MMFLSGQGEGKGTYRSGFAYNTTTPIIDEEDVSDQNNEEYSQNGNRVHQATSPSEHTLSDETMIAKTNWRNLKQSAMRHDYRQQVWFLQMNNDEKELLARLIAAQRIQGDMRELQIPSIR